MLNKPQNDCALDDLHHSRSLLQLRNAEQTPRWAFANVNNNSSNRYGCELDYLKTVEMIEIQIRQVIHSSHLYYLPKNIGVMWCR